MFKTIANRAEAFLLFIGVLAAVCSPAMAKAAPDGVVKVRSAHPSDETVSRLQADVAQKKIVFFLAVDQTKLAADAGLPLRPSTLLIFGNPPLGAQLISSNPRQGSTGPSGCS